MGNRSIICILTLVVLIGLTSGQAQIKIEGKVRHANSYNVLRDVNIYLAQQKSAGTHTAYDGSFKITVSDADSLSTLVFEHVAFDTLYMSVIKASKRENFYLNPRVVEVPAITIQAYRNRLHIANDIPQSVILVEAEKLNRKGFVDVGDMLRTMQSIQVDEELSGQKTLALRGGNNDDIMFMINGVQVNNTLDNQFDISLINPNDLKQIQIIHGSNSSIYGPTAFSGVINMVPRFYKDYTARFTQKVGTYNAGDWQLQLNHNFDSKLNISGSYSEGKNNREIVNQQSANNEAELKNSRNNTMVNLIYDLSDENTSVDNYNINLVYMGSNDEYSNGYNGTSLKRNNNFISGQLIGRFGFFDQIRLTGALNQNTRDQTLQFEEGYYQQQFDDRQITFRAEHQMTFYMFEALLGYNFKKGRLNLLTDGQETVLTSRGLKDARLTRQGHGLVSILKFHVPTHSHFINTADLNFAVRQDFVDTDADNVNTFQSSSIYDISNLEKEWYKPTFKFSSLISGHHSHYRFNAFLNFGTNVKFPTLFQQLSMPLENKFTLPGQQPTLGPEQNRSLEIGLTMKRSVEDESNVNGWKLDFNLFKNYYENKFRLFYVPGIPIPFYDNVQNANIDGIESRNALYLFRKKLTLEFGASLYGVSERAAFPFKSSKKYIFNVIINHAGYALQMNTFRENEQQGWIREFNGGFYEIYLPGYNNMDIHLSKTFDLWRMGLFFNASVMNVFDDDTRLEGLAIRDRRFYVSFGVEY
ncbi:MAG: TonB-dependent receptor plug domain-containing protein [Caldithrix sp.]|nr:TonB-dependent receptor plug domain-containing protein [Caldithrix sp.]